MSVLNVTYVNQFARTPWQDAPDAVRSVASVCAEVVSFLKPETAPTADLLAHDLEQQFMARGQSGPILDTAPMLAYLRQQGASLLDLSALVAAGDAAQLAGEVRAQSACGIVHIVCVRDESQLRLAGRNVPLHGYSEQGISHALLSVGTQDADVDLYLDSAAPAFVRPTPIAWASVQAAGITAVYGVLPAGIPVPPPDFRYFTLNQYGQGVAHVWPEPVVPEPVAPALDPAPIVARVEQAQAGVENALSTLASWESQPFSALPGIFAQATQQLREVQTAHTQAHAALVPSSTSDTTEAVL